MEKTPSLVALPVLEPSPVALLRRRIFGHAGLLIGSRCSS